MISKSTSIGRCAAVATLFASALVACGEDESARSTTPAARRVDVSQVRLEPVPSGGGVAQPSATAVRSHAGDEVPRLSESYAETEYLLHGEAHTYSGSPIGTPMLETSGNRYTTRILIRRPVRDADFSGRVFIEPFNTTLDRDLDALWARRLGPLFERNGDIWIGVTVRSLGADNAKDFDPVRYADLELPVNDYAWDILRQLGRLVKDGGEPSPLGDLDVQYLYMGGYSQSGVDTAAFLSAFHAFTRTEEGSPIYDGSLPAAHAASITELQSGDARLPGFTFSAMTPVDVPVIDFETQSDALGFDVTILGFVFYHNPGGASVRRADSDAPTDLFRLYELAGASHAGKIDGCDGNGSSLPVAYFIRAVADLLFAWTEDGIAPPRAGRIEMEVLDEVSKAAVDGFGNAIGGVRSPFVDVPLVTYDAQGEGGLLCPLAGDETPLPPQVLADRYGSVDAYLADFSRSLDATTETGFLRDEDRTAILDAARVRAVEILGSD